MIVNLKIRTTSLTDLGVLGALLIRRGGNDIYGLTCKHVVDELKPSESLYYYTSSGRIKVSDKSRVFHSSEYLDYSLLKLEEDFVNVIREWNFGLADTKIAEIGDRVDKVINGQLFSGKTTSTPHEEVVIAPLDNSPGKIHDYGHSGSIWYIYGYYGDNFHGAVGLHHEGVDKNAYAFSLDDIFHDLGNNFEFFNRIS